MDMWTFTPLTLSILIYLSLFWQVNGKTYAQSRATSNINRKFYHHVDGTDYYAEHNVTIASSPFFTQRLIGELIKQLLSNKLGYRSVQYVSSEDPASVSVAQQNCSSNPCVKSLPEALIDFEPSSRTLRSDFTDAGSLGLTTRYGFYMSAAVLQEVGDNAQTVANSYESLKNERVVRKLTAFNHQIIEALNTHRKTAGTECTDDATRCDGIVYTSPTCSRNGSSCPILLLGNSDFTVAQVEETISVLNLTFQVADLGKDLNQFVLNLSKQGVPLLFLSRAPDLLTSDITYTRIRSYDTLCSAYDGDCHFPVMELRKVVWARLMHSEPAIYQLVKNVYLEEYRMRLMMNEYKNFYGPIVTSSLVEQYITKWLATQRVSHWLPPGSTEKPRLLIGGFFPLSLDALWKDPSLVTAAEMGVEAVNKDSAILNEYDLQLLVNDTACDSSHVLNIFTEYLVDRNVWSRMVGGLGPACADTAIAVAGLATHYNYVMISYSVEAIVLSVDRKRYKYFFRTIPQIKEYAKVYVALFKKLGWTRSKITMLTDDSSGEFPVYHRYMGHEFKNHDEITLSSQESLPRKEYLISLSKDGKNIYGKYLDKIKESESNIIIMDVYKDVARSIMCEAYRKGMTIQQGYYWFLPYAPSSYDWYEPPPNRTDTDCDLKEMTEAVRGHFSLTHAWLDSTGAVSVGGVNGTTFKRLYQQRVKNTTYADEQVQRFPSDYGPYTYDAVWAFAKALQSLHELNPAYLKYLHTNYATERFIEMIHKIEFQGVSGVISFDKHGDRSGITDIMQYNNMSEDDFFDPTRIGYWSNGTLTLYKDRIQWGQVKILPTKPPVLGHCEWESLRQALGIASCSTALLVIVIPTCIMVILIIIIGAFTALGRAKRKYRHAAGLASKYNDGRSAFINLDEKEIPRDHVVLNRKLGQGAFGTVYGGEAYIHQSWIGVAVKTLQVGSNSEEKLDFLREADIMKRFDNKNIVKLLGVTTRGEPAYAIMEFMLYGDLKTYLLSRRELVGLDTKEAEDISAGSLTKMAIDIIEGLCYLHNKEYIHRDIASRNCLVSSNRTVKIGDFGMTRRVYEDGSYIFTRRGKLPVRWMAPESFIDGVFTYKTDIWSYGVLLYEIITFGSIPYQMQTNAEVFESVKTGNHLSLPEECTDELKTLMLSCWNVNPIRRLSPYEIYGTLCNNENMIQPLLSCPALAKLRECDSVDLDLSPTFLKASSLIKKPFLRQSSSVISVDTGTSYFSRHRNHSEISYRRSASHRRRSSHSIIDLFSLVNPLTPSPTTPMSIPSPSHSTGQNSNFHFTIDSRYNPGGDTCCDVKSAPSTQCRVHHSSGSGCAGTHTVIAENDYLLTTRSCSEIDERSNHSHTPLIHTGETAI